MEEISLPQGPLVLKLILKLSSSPQESFNVRLTVSEADGWNGDQLFLATACLMALIASSSEDGYEMCMEKLVEQAMKSRLSSTSK